MTLAKCNKAWGTYHELSTANELQKVSSLYNIDVRRAGTRTLRFTTPRHFANLFLLPITHRGC